MTKRQKERQHVFPVNDLMPHNTDNGAGCWCKPTIDNDVVIHNSLDGRELIETGERMVQ